MHAPTQSSHLFFLQIPLLSHCPPSRIRVSSGYPILGLGLSRNGYASRLLEAPEQISTAPLPALA